MRRFFLVVGIFWSLTAPLAAIEISSVIPSTASPGASVTLSGGPFTSASVVLLGRQRLPADEIVNGRLVFTVPALPSGEYALAVEQGGKRSTPTFVLRIIQPLPRIHSINPITLDSCPTGSVRQITVTGSNFLPGSSLLLDNAALPAERRSANEIVFRLPGAIKSGLHQVQVANTDNQRSLPHGLVVDSTPEISDVQIGEDRVVAYDLILHGRNFLVNSRLTVNGVMVGSGAVTGNIPLAGHDAPVIRTDSVRFIDCTTLIYLRHPYVRDAKELTLQVINPGGEQSNAYQITTP